MYANSEELWNVLVCLKREKLLPQYREIPRDRFPAPLPSIMQS